MSFPPSIAAQPAFRVTITHSTVGQYYQEVGRAGRDGQPGFGVLLYTEVNAKVRRDMIREALRMAEQVREVWNEALRRSSS